MTIPPWHEEPISRACDREAFDCGDTVLNAFLRRHARKSHERGGAKTFLAINDGDGKTILGFYSLAPASIAYDRTPLLIKRGLARHEVPVFRLARLAVDRSIQGGAASAASFSLQQVAVAFWSHQRLVVSHSSLMPKTSGLLNGTQDMALFSSLTNRFRCSCPSSPFTLHSFRPVSSKGTSKK